MAALVIDKYNSKCCAVALIWSGAGMRKIALVFLLMLGSCEEPPLATAAPPPSTSASLAAQGYQVKKVFFSTDRKLTGETKPNYQFGADRSDVLYGVSYVSIPQRHSTGAIERPSIWRFEFSEDPEKHVVLLQSDLLSKDLYYADLASRIRESGDRSALLFVHGYNVGFSDAAHRTAQMAYDLNFSGAPIFFSWPSNGAKTLSTLLYVGDEAQVEWAEPDMKVVLNDLLSLSDVRSVYLIAHSMGNRVLTRALASLLVEKPHLKSKIREIILAAPDIDADVFKRSIAPALVGAGRPITLYASSDDNALKASEKVHQWPRLGQAGQSLVVMPGIETVDATGVDTSFLAHSYFGSTRRVISDICQIMQSGTRASSRTTLQQASSSPPLYWKFTDKAECRVKLAGGW